MKIQKKCIDVPAVLGFLHFYLYYFMILLMNISFLGFLELPDNIKGLKSLEHFDLSVNPLGRYVCVVTSPKAQYYEIWPAQ